MTDAELRALVRDAVARHLGRSTPTPSIAPVPAQAATTTVVSHASHALYVTLVNTDGACVIEPAVQCNHCGYCKSHGF